MANLKFVQCLAAGQRVRFPAEGIDGEHTGHVQRLSPRIDPETRTLLIEATVSNEKGILRPGLFARCAIEIGQPTPRVTLPRSTVVAFAGVEKVFVVEGGAVSERLVKTGRRVDEVIEIVEGLSTGTEVVRVPEGLVSGQRVTVEG